MGYANPLLAHGIRETVDMSKARGADGLIVGDWPPREAARALLPALAKAQMSFVPLWIAPLAVDALRLDAPSVGGFLYCIPQAGPNGGPPTPIAAAAAAVARCRAFCNLPIAVGFGIKTAEAAAAIARHADIVVVGTALIDHINLSLGKTSNLAAALGDVTGFCSQFRHAIDGL